MIKRNLMPWWGWLLISVGGFTALTYVIVIVIVFVGFTRREFRD